MTFHIWKGSLGFTDSCIHSGYKNCKFLAPSVNYKTYPMLLGFYNYVTLELVKYYLDYR